MAIETGVKGFTQQPVSRVEDMTVIGKIYFAVVWHIVIGFAVLIFALMMVAQSAFDGTFLEGTARTLNDISEASIFRWLPEGFIDNFLPIFFVVFGMVMVGLVPGLLQRQARARLTSLALNYIGMLLTGFYMLRQMTVNEGLLRAMSGGDADTVARLVQGAQILPMVLLFGLAAWALFGQKVGLAFKETLDQREAIFAYLYISPYLLLASIFTIGLLIMAFYLSFNDLDLYGPVEWNGLNNYEEALSDKKFLVSISNVVWYALIVVVFQTTIAFGLAMLMNERFGGRRFFRTLFYAPSVTSSVVISLIFLWLFSGRGFVNQIVFGTLGLGGFIEDLGIKIPPGSPGLQWYNTPNRLGDLTYLKPFFSDTWYVIYAVLLLALLIVMVSRAVVWFKRKAFSQRGAQRVFGVGAVASVILVGLNAALRNVEGAENLVRSSILLSALGIAIGAIVMNRLKTTDLGNHAIRSTIVGGAAWMLVVVLANLVLGGEINGINAGVIAMGGAVFALLVGVIAASVSFIQTRKPPTEMLVGEHPALIEQLSEVGGVGLPVLLSMLVAACAAIASAAYGMEQGSQLGDNKFDALLMRGPSVAFMTIMLQNIFTTAPTFMLMYLAALQDVSPSLYEAAQIDGANPWQRFTKITVPLLRPVTLLVVVLSTIGTLQLFDQVAIITKGGPLDTTLVPVYLIYTTALGSQIQARVGYASAMAFILGAIIFTFTYIQRRYLEEGTEAF